MRILISLAICLLLFLFSGCDQATDTADTAEGGGEGAVSTAEDMSDGSLKGADIDSGTLPGEEEAEDY